MQEVFVTSALLVPIALVAGFLILMVLALVWQRKGLTTQQQAMSTVEEGMQLSRRGVELTEQAVALGEESLKVQREMVQALHQLRALLAADTEQKPDPRRQATTNSIQSLASRDGSA